MATVLATWFLEPYSWADIALRVVGEDAILSVILLLSAFLVSFALRKRTASVRHWIWVTAFSGLLVLPLLTLVLPRWSVPIVPRIELRTGEYDLRAPGDSVQTAVLSPGNTTALDESEGSDTGTLIIPASSLRSIANNLLGDLPQKANRFSRRARGQMDMLNWPALLIAIWIGISAVLFLKLLVSIVRVAAISRNARRVQKPVWWAAAKEVAGGLGLDREFDIRWSSRIRSPLTWGCRRPVLLLPATAPDWEEERRTIVLVHEIAHVKRCDWVVQFCAHIVACVYWFNPLVWLGFRKLRYEHERACDDHVIRWGVSPTTYAEHLVDMARSFWTARSVSRASVGMARKSQLEGRVVSILDRDRQRGLVGLIPRVFAAVVLGVFLVSVVIIRPVATRPSLQGSHTEDIDRAAHVEAVAYSVSPIFSPDRQPDQVCRDMRETYTIDNRRSVSLKNTWGSIEITGWDRSDVRVEAATCAYAVERLVEARVDVSETPGSLDIKSVYDDQNIDWSKRPGRLERKPAIITYTVFVPNATRLGSIRVTHGDVHVHNVSGRIVAEAVHGDVAITGLQQSAQISSVDGTVRTEIGRMRTGSTVRISSVNGPVWVSLPGDTDAHVRAHSVTGQIENDFGHRDAKRGRSRLSRMMGFGRSVVLIESINGSINIERASTEMRAHRIETRGETYDEPAYASTTNEYIEQLRDPSRRVRARAARVLGMMDHPAAIPALVEAAQDDDWMVRVEVAKALGRYDHPKAQRALEALRNDRNSTVRRHANKTLRTRDKPNGRIGWNMDEETFGVEHEVVEELQGLGLAAEEYGLNAAEVGVEVLRDVLHDIIVEFEDRKIRIAINEEDVELDADEVRDVLEQVDRRFSRWSARTLERMEEQNVGVELRRAAEKARQEIAEVTLRAQIELLEPLADLPDGAGVPRLKEIAREHEHPAVRRSAKALLKTIDHPRARRALRDLR